MHLKINAQSTSVQEATPLSFSPVLDPGSDAVVRDWFNMDDASPWISVNQDTGEMTGTAPVYDGGVPGNNVFVVPMMIAHSTCRNMGKITVTVTEAP